ncbi:MAG TPA: ABC transporter substrate-binding protein [Candidatus Limnocylindrales bacterium]|nr:ABC transporter substrate-binding protein [Candidatus Limnocylindrales bacterium]
MTWTSPEEEDVADQINALTFDEKNPGRKTFGADETSLFRLEKWEPGKYAKLIANWESREGMPYVDAIEIQIGRTAHDRLLGLELGKSDFAPLPPQMARQAMDHGVRVSVSKPDELLALVFDGGVGPDSGPPVDERAREALAATIDRASIVNFILQKNGEAAGGLLPQWSSGTAFLFSTASNPARAKELWAQIPGPPKLVLGYDSGDALEQSVADRIVVNSREAGIPLAAQMMAKSTNGKANVNARLVRLRMISPEPRAALEKFVSTLARITGLEADPLLDPASPEEIYTRERGIVDTYRVIPLVWLPRVYGLSARVRNWVAPGPGETWPLADVWLDTQGEAGEKDKP